MFQTKSKDPILISNRLFWKTNWSYPPPPLFILYYVSLFRYEIPDVNRRPTISFNTHADLDGHLTRTCVGRFLSRLSCVSLWVSHLGSRRNQVESATFKKMCEFLDVSRSRTTTYYLATNSYIANGRHYYWPLRIRIDSPKTSIRPFSVLKPLLRKASTRILQNCFI